jgi:WD40 repeat protein
MTDLLLTAICLQVGKSHSFLYHAACIWGVESYPSSKEGLKGVLPNGSFVTCSSDDTIRVWNLDPNMGTNTIYRRNIYSNVSRHIPLPFLSTCLSNIFSFLILCASRASL